MNAGPKLWRSAPAIKTSGLPLATIKNLISSLRVMREILRNKPKVKRKSHKKKKLRKPTLLSDRALKMFGKMSPEMQEYILYGDKN